MAKPRAISEEVARLIRANSDGRARRDAMRQAMQHLTEAFLAIGAAPLECADVCDGAAQRLRGEHERRKREERGRK